MENDHQKNIFKTTEGNAYFERNRKYYVDQWATTPFHLQVWEDYIEQDCKVLELGTANGRNLQYLKDKKNITGHGVDPSEEAIAIGQKTFPELNLSVGTADSLDFPAESMDVVAFGFCLYVVDRNLLMKVISEADRVLKNNGRLLITDFDPPYPQERNLSHYKGLKIFKMNYSKLFLSNPAYCLVSKSSYSDSSHTFAKKSEDRLGVWVLQKDTAGAYAFIE